MNYLNNGNYINSFLDNDKSGNNTLDKLVGFGYFVSDQSKRLYPKCKDFNDFLVNSMVF
jgi:hypothetical protein